MALQSTKIIPSLQEKRYYTLQFIEAATIGGSKVKIIPVAKHSVTELSGEVFNYNTGKSIDTYIIFEERPKVNLLKSLGWYREDGQSPIIAYIPTHVLRKYNLKTEYTTKDFFIDPDGHFINYLNKDIIIKQGTKISLKDDYTFYDVTNIHLLTENEWSTDVIGAQDTSVIFQEDNFVYFRYNLSKPPILLRDFSECTPHETEVFEDDEVLWDPASLELLYKGSNTWHITRLVTYLDEDAFAEHQYISERFPIAKLIDKISTYEEVLTTGQVVNYYALQNLDVTKLVQTGRTDDYILDELPIIRGTKLDIEYDFLPDVLNPLDPMGGRIRDMKGVVNSFFVTDVKVDLVSLNYIASLIPYQGSISKEDVPKSKNDLNSAFIKFDSNDISL